MVPDWPTKAHLASTVVLRIKTFRPLIETGFSKLKVLAIRRRKLFKIPALCIRPPNHDQINALTGTQRKGSAGLSRPSSNRASMARMACMIAWSLSGAEGADSLKLEPPRGLLSFVRFINGRFDFGFNQIPHGAEFFGWQVLRIGNVPILTPCRAHEWAFIAATHRRDEVESDFGNL